MGHKYPWSEAARIKSLEAEVSALRAQRDELREVLLSVRDRDFDGSAGYCWCANWGTDSKTWHDEECERARAIFEKAREP